MNPLFHCSRLKDICTKTRYKPNALGETAKAAVIEQFLYDHFNYKRTFATIDTINGQLMEAACIGMISSKYIKNEITLQDNELALIGTPDLYWPKERIIEVKTTRNPITFTKDCHTGPHVEWVYQVHGYMMLANLKRCRIHYFLVDTHESLKKPSWLHGYAALADDELERSIFSRAEQEYEMDNISNIPTSFRGYSWDIQFDEDLAENITKSVGLAIEYYRSLKYHLPNE